MNFSVLCEIKTVSTMSACLSETDDLAKGYENKLKFMFVHLEVLMSAGAPGGLCEASPLHPYTIR